MVVECEAVVCGWSWFLDFGCGVSGSAQTPNPKPPIGPFERDVYAESSAPAARNGVPLAIVDGKFCLRFRPSKCFKLEFWSQSRAAVQGSVAERRFG